MKPAPFGYRRVHSVEEALAALRDSGGDVKLVAGGQSLGPMLNLRLARPAMLIDIGTIEALTRIDERPDCVRIGACVTHARIEDEAGGIAGIECLARVARGIAYRAVRNRGTIGGSLAHADPAADWPLALAALGATIELASRDGTRRIDAASFMVGGYATQLAEGEMVVAVEVPKMSRSARWAYQKFCRKPGEFAEAAAAILLDSQRRVARIFVGAPADRPTGLPALAREVARRGRDGVAADGLGGHLDPVLAHAAPARRQACRVMLGRALEQVLQ
ncbi:MAG: FAD binding domain-containing protein [Burkholderiaceae bacterium]|nr:FAD binding domain-containing protein [Burkholderiaceae bacterium]